MTNADQRVRAILQAERLTEQSPEMAPIRTERERVKSLLTEAFGASGVSMRDGGSKAKNTMLKRDHDLDMLYYAHADNDRVGGTLKDIYDNVLGVLANHYDFSPGTTAVRLFAKGRARTGPGPRGRAGQRCPDLRHRAAGQHAHRHRAAIKARHR